MRSLCRNLNIIPIGKTSLFNNSINHHLIQQLMVKDEIGGRSVDITKEDGKIMSCVISSI